MGTESFGIMVAFLGLFLLLLLILVLLLLLRKRRRNKDKHLVEEGIDYEENYCYVEEGETRKYLVATKSQMRGKECKGKRNKAK